MGNEQVVYQRIGEFAVSFQWIENKLREIGWFVIDPHRKKWPPPDLRNLTNERLVDKVHDLFLEALPKCRLGLELETDFRESFARAVIQLHRLRRDRNRILHSAFIEMKAGGDVHGLLRSGTRYQVDDETGDAHFDQEILTEDSFSNEMKAVAELAMFLNRAYMQLIHRYPHGGI